MTIKAPFPWFGGKSSVAEAIWRRLGSPKQYIEPFCGSAAILLAAPSPASLEVIGDANCYIANFWRSLKLQPDAVIEAQDYPVSHIDLFARHRWLTEPARVETLRDALLDPEWPGDAKIAGWWLWGQCCWIGSGWCDPARGQRGKGSAGGDGLGQIPHTANAGMGVQAVTLGKIPHASDAGRGAAAWLRELADRLARVRIVHGDWSRCLNHHYGDTETAVFLDPPYRAFEKLYSDNGAPSTPVADDVAAWAREHAHLRVALCGHRGDYTMPGWSAMEWSRGRLTYGGKNTTDAECIWFSPGCLPDVPAQVSMFGGAA
jgi:DNA adenine methylase